MHKHDWMTGLLCEVETYCIANKLDDVASVISTAISLVIESIENTEHADNVINLFEYRDQKFLMDRERIVSAYSGNFIEIPNEK